MRLAAAVRETLSPLMTEITEDLAAVGEKVDSLSRDLEKHKNQTTTELVDMNSKLDSLDSKQDGLNMTMMTVNSELEKKMMEDFKKISDFQMAHHGYKCGGIGGWRRVVYLNMTDPNTNCPSGWRLIIQPKRTCGRVFSSSSHSCNSVFFPVCGGDYTSVCGSIRAYQYSGLDAFQPYH